MSAPQSRSAARSAARGTGFFSLSSAVRRGSMEAGSARERIQSAAQDRTSWDFDVRDCSASSCARG